MEGRRRQKWDKNRRSQNKRPPRGNWQPTVPKWEKEFCKVVGSLDWETLLQMKKFTHLYENVIKWNDSAGEEAFSNAKKRFWAEINGRYCHLSLPDPDLYIDKIDWDSEINPELLAEFESEPMTSNAGEDHDPVVIFGDSLFPNQAYSLTGWGDEEENFKVAANSSSANHGENWGNSFDNGAAIGWQDYSNNVGYMTWGDGCNNDWNWNYANNNNNNNNNTIYQVGPGLEHKIAGGEKGPCNDRIFASGQQPDRRRNSREWNSFNSCGPVSHHAAITVGQKWNQ